MKPRIPSLVVGIPARYIHIHCSFSALADLENAILFGQKVLEALNPEIISGF